MFADWVPPHRATAALIAVLAMAGVVLAACGTGSSRSPEATQSSSGGSAQPSSPTTTPFQAGSSTIVPITTPTTLHSQTSQSAPSGVQYGPGPQSTYTIQAQLPAGSCHYRYEGNDPLPDPGCTPGALNPQVTQATLYSTICRSGYASSIRPPESVTEPEKQGSASAYGYTGSFSTGEYDHLVPLELGGDPNDPANLWIEPNDNPNATSTSNAKDILENRLNNLVCSGQLPLATAQEAIASNWVTAYRTYVGTPPTYSSPSSPTTSSGVPPPAGGGYCTASAAPANDGYSGDYYVTVESNQPNQKATANDAGDSWSQNTDSSGYARILLYHTSPGEQISVTVGTASCSTTA